MNLTVKRRDASYEVEICRGLIKRAGKELALDCKVLLVTDSGIPRTYVQTILSQCKEPTLVTIPAGDEHKNLATYENLLSVALAADLTRGDCVVSLGGGMVGDLAGFVAATYLRGIDFYNIPTTLLAMADASVGGKTGLNLGGYKNQVGAFYQPKKVLIDPDLLATLDARHMSCGYAEVLKMALTLDADLFYRIEDGSVTLEEMIRRAVELKASVVCRDEREDGARRVLNFGHTLGHAIESASGGSLLHGECVALGMIPMCPESLQKRLLPILERYGLPTRCKLSPDAVIGAILHDKKRYGDKLTIVLATEPGKSEQHSVSLEAFLQTIAKAPVFFGGERT